MFSRSQAMLAPPSSNTANTDEPKSSSKPNKHFMQFFNLFYVPSSVYMTLVSLGSPRLRTGTLHQVRSFVSRFISLVDYRGTLSIFLSLNFWTLGILGPGHPATQIPTQLSIFYHLTFMYWPLRCFSSFGLTNDVAREIRREIGDRATPKKEAVNSAWGKQGRAGLAP